MTVCIDFECRSELDVRDVGAYKYSRHPSTEVLCMAYKIDAEPVKLWVPGFTRFENQLPFAIRVHLAPGVAGRLEAHNANFEINIWNHICVPDFGWPQYDAPRWRCSAVKAAMYSLPRKLETVAAVLGLASQKDMAGHRVMLQLTKARNPSKNNPDRYFSDDKRFKKLYKYCKIDVETEYALSQYLRPLNEDEWFYWFMDQKINRRGIYVDLKGIRAAIRLNKKLEIQAGKRLKKLTGGFVQRATEVPKIKVWSKKNGFVIKSLAKDKLPGLLKNKKIPKKIRKVIKLRDQNNKSSNSKLQKMVDCVNEDGRIRDYLLFYGAHTGRWTGTLVQTTNLPKGSLKYPQVVEAIRAIKRGDTKTISKLGNPLDVISSCIRGFFCAPEGREFVCGDYSSIEAALVLWVAGEKEAVEQIKKGRDIYKELASEIHSKLVEEVNDEERDHGKRGVLGGGYGMGWRKLQSDALEKYGVVLSDQICKAIIAAYRSKYSKVPEVWKAFEKAAIDCVFHKKTTRVQGIDLDIRFKRKGRFLLMRLPSGRILSYYKPRLTYGKFDKLQLTYMGVHSQSKQFVKKYVWGGVVFQNAIQSMARDAMVYGMQQVENTATYDVLLNVYDEVLSECDKGAGDAAEYAGLLTRVEPWAEGAPIIIKPEDVWIGKRYRKG